MTALGINVSDKDQTHDWTGLVSGHKLSAAIYEADQEEKRCWDYFTFNVDSWIEAKYEAYARGDNFKAQDLVNKIAWAQEKAELATLHAQSLRKQRHCKHPIVRDYGEGVFCSECGAEVVIHDTSIAANVDEWQS